MDRENPTPPKRQYKNGVTAAFDICDARRAMATGIEPSPHEPGGMRREVERTAVIVEAAAAKLDAKDFTALETVCANHVLALDVIFGEFAREAASWDGGYLSRPSMGTALRAQTNCRLMLRTLLSLAAPKPKGEGGLSAAKENKNSDDRNIESANPPA